MTAVDRDQSLDALLDLHDLVLVVDLDDRHWVKFAVHRVKPSPERAHGLDYSLTLHDAEGRRLVGLDNAHPVRHSAAPGGRLEGACDHRHRLRAVRPYDHADAATLLADSWAEVDAVPRERGVIE